MNSQFFDNFGRKDSIIRLVARDVADAHGIKFDAERDAAGTQSIADELTFVKEYLPGKAQDMCDNCDSLDDVGAWLDLEFQSWLSDKNHD